jgi:hypothetical protein
MKSRLFVVFTFLVVAVCSGSAQGMQVEGEWDIVPSPNGASSQTSIGGTCFCGNTLWDVAALSPTDAWAVGTQPNQSQYLPKPLAMHWNGTQWSLVNTPTIDVTDVRFNAVAAVSSNDVWAVGYSYDYDCGLCAQTLIQHWDGQSWSIVPSPNPGWSNQLYGVSARAANDIWAVGDQWLDWSAKVPLILHYNGVAWQVVNYPPVSFGELNSVSALAENDVWAVGVSGVISTGIAPLALHWDGTSWTAVPVPNEADYVALYSVSGVASNDVWAVGVNKYANWQGQYLSVARTYHWDGTSWTSVLPGVFGIDSRMYDVHAVASDDAWAVGGEPGPIGSGVAFRYVTVHWDGLSWSNVENPNQGVLYAVSASSSSDAWAVGFGMDALAYSTGTHTLRYTVGCYADIDDSGAVDVNDLLAVIQGWGTCAIPGNCLPDVNHSGAVDVDDLLAVISDWGPC